MPNFSQIWNEDFSNLLWKEETLLLDVRTKQEQLLYWVISDKQIHIDISLREAGDKILELDKNKHYLIYCWHGVRSQSVLEYMKNNWFTQLNDLAGWIDAWNK